MEREGWDSEMKELLADFKVAYATTEPRLRVDVRMFSLYLIWMSTRGCRFWSAALFGTIAPPFRCLSWLRWCGFELFKVLKSLVSPVVRLPRVASADLCAQQRSGQMQPPVHPRQRDVQRCEPARKVLRCLPAAVLRPSPLSLWLSHCVSLHSSSLPISLSPPTSPSLSLSRTDGD